VEPYYLSTSGVDKPGHRKLLEVPMTILYISEVFKEKSKMHNILHKLPNNLMYYCQRFANLKWLKVFPDTDGEDLINLYNISKDLHLPVMIFTINSSELMPGGVSSNKNIENVEHIYKVLEIFFNHLSAEEVKGIILSDFAKIYK